MYQKGFKFMTKETILLSENELKDIQKLANAIADNSELVNLISCYLYDMAKEDKKTISGENISLIECMPIEENQDLPESIVLFLQHNILSKGNKEFGCKKLRMQRLQAFIYFVREAILEYLHNNNNSVSLRDIKNYSEIFNMRYIKEHVFTSKKSSVLKLAIAVALSDNDKFSVFDSNPIMTKHIEFIFRLINEEQFRSLLEVYNIYFNNH